MVIIAINLRSFSEAWTLENTFQRRKETLTLHGKGVFLWEPWIYPALVFGAKEERAKLHEYQADVREAAKSHYFYSLSRFQPNLRALTRLSATLKTGNRKALFYVTPINNEVIQRETGTMPDLGNTLSMIRGALSGFPLLDYSHSLGAADFLWPEERAFVEHLRSSGRQFVANHVAAEVD